MRTVDNPLADDNYEVSLLREELADALTENERLRDALKQISQWDMVTQTGNGSYWQREIERFLS